MATRPGIRTLNTAYNTVGRPTSPANYRGSGVRPISPTLATQQRRTEILATGRKGAAPQIRPEAAAVAAGTVITQSAQNLLSAANQGAQSFADAVRRLFPENVPLVNIPSVEISGINKPVIENPAQIVGAAIQTSQYTPELVNEARVRAQKGDVVSGLYAATADSPFVRGVRETYQRVQGPGYTPTSKALAGVLLSAGGVVASVPAVLQAVNFARNPNRMAYTGQLPQRVSGVEVQGAIPRISADTMTISVDEVEAANTVLGSVGSSLGEIARQEIPKAVEAIKTEFVNNPYGLAGQILGGAVLAKGIGSALPKRAPGLGVQGEPAAKPRVQTGNRQTRPTKEDATPGVTADYTIKAAGKSNAGSSVPKRVGTVGVRDTVSAFAVRDEAVSRAALGAGLGAAVLANGQRDSGVLQSVPQTVPLVQFSVGNGLIDDAINEYPKRPESGEENANRRPTGTDNRNAGGTLVVNPSKYGNTLRIEGGYQFQPELAPRIEYVRVSELMGDDTAARTRNRTTEENATRNRTQNRQQEEYLYEYPYPTGVRTARTRRRIDIDIDIPRPKARKRKAKVKRRYGKRQIVNPLPWLWDEEPGFSRKLPETVDVVSVSELLA